MAYGMPLQEHELYKETKWGAEDSPGQRYGAARAGGGQRQRRAETKKRSRKSVRGDAGVPHRQITGAGTAHPISPLAKGRKAGEQRGQVQEPRPQSGGSHSVCAPFSQGCTFLFEEQPGKRVEIRSVECARKNLKWCCPWSPMLFPPCSTVLPRGHSEFGT